MSKRAAAVAVAGAAPGEACRLRALRRVRRSPRAARAGLLRRITRFAQMDVDVGKTVGNDTPRRIEDFVGCAGRDVFADCGDSAVGDEYVAASAFAAAYGCAALYQKFTSAHEHAI